MMTYFEHKNIWLTGASTGIGRAIADRLVHVSCTLIVSARHSDKLQEMANGATKARVVIIPVDVSSKDSVVQATSDIRESVGHLDIVILNAGTNDYVDIHHFDSDLFERIMTVNYLGLIRCIEFSLPLLRASPSPHIVGLSSVAAYLGLTKSAAYCASKAAIRLALQSLQVDFGPSMAITIVCPGFVKTPLTDRNDFDMPFIMSAEKASGYILKGIAKRQFEISFPFIFASMLKVLSRLPDRFRTSLLRSATNAE